MARKHFNAFGRPLGFLHCSVVDSDDVESFARNGNTFGKDFGGQRLSFREVRIGMLLPIYIYTYRQEHVLLVYEYVLTVNS